VRLRCLSDTAVITAAVFGGLSSLFVIKSRADNRLMWRERGPMLHSVLILKSLPHSRAVVLSLVLSIIASLTGAWPLGAQPGSGGQNTIEIAQGVRVIVPSPWFLAFRTQNSVELAYPLKGSRQELRRSQGEEKPSSGESLVTAEARTSIQIETRLSYPEAVARLAQIASEVPEPSNLIVIAGWPAIEWRRMAPLPNPGEAERFDVNPALSLFATTAIAAGTVVVRFDTVLAPNADRELAEAAFRLAKSILVRPGDAVSAQRELETISRLIRAP
jgi:hypothetical protein